MSNHYGGYTPEQINGYASTVRDDANPGAVNVATGHLLKALQRTIAHICDSVFVKGTDREDLEQECALTILQVCRTYNDDYPFADWAYASMRRRMMDLYKIANREKTGGQAHHCSLDTVLDIPELLSGNDGTDAVDHIDDYFSLEVELLPMLSPLETMIYFCWFEVVYAGGQPRELYELIGKGLKRHYGRRVSRDAIDNGIQRIREKAQMAKIKRRIKSR